MMSSPLCHYDVFVGGYLGSVREHGVLHDVESVGDRAVP